MKILIPLGSGSSWQDNELRYALRSVYQNLEGVTGIFIVGQLPPWLKVKPGLTFVPFSDLPGSRHKEQNINRKILRGIEAMGNDPFLFMNDDHFILKRVKAKDFPFHHKGDLADSILAQSRLNPYKISLKNTFGYLTMKGHRKIYNYDTHCPMVIDPVMYSKFLRVLNFPPYGYVLKTMYATQMKVQGEYYPDLKIKDSLSLPELEQLIADRPYFSIGGQATNQALEQLLETLFPNPTIFEL